MLLANGTYEFSETDLELPARVIPIEWKRSYRSNRIIKNAGGGAFGEPKDGPLGFGWMTPYFMRIENLDTLVDGEGIYTLFKRDSAGNFLPDYDKGLILKQTASGYEVLELGANTYLFSTEGKLTSIRDPRGKAVSINYDETGRITSVMDVTGRQALSFSYNPAGRISSATDAAERTVNYEYDQIGRLVRVYDSVSVIAEYAYNSYHGITSKSNALGETTRIEYEYADRGVIKSVTDPAGRQMTFSYDFAGGLFSLTDFNGGTRIKQVNSSGKLLSESEASAGQPSGTLKRIDYLAFNTEKVTDSAGNEYTIQKDIWGNITKITDGEGNETRFAYDSQKRLISMTDALGVVTRIEYDSYGSINKVIQAAGRPEETVTTYTYNSFGEVTSKQTGNAITSVSYNQNGQPSSITDPMGAVTLLDYDTAGRLTSVTDPLKNRTEFAYDSRGNLLSSKDPLGGITSYAHNLANRPVSITDPLGRTTRIETDFSERVTSITDPMGNAKYYSYDGNGNLLTIAEGDAVTTMTYDSSNRLLSVIDAMGNVTRYEYAGGAACTTCGSGGSAATPARITDPLGNVTQNVFDKAGRPTIVTDRDGNFTIYSYDAVGRLKKKLYPDSTFVEYEYDALGRIKKAINQHVALTFTYDQYGNITSAHDGRLDKTVAYTYDLSGRRMSMTAEGKTTTYEYDNSSNLKSITASGKVFSFGYDELGRRTSLAYPNGIEANYVYDSASELLNLNNKFQSNEITKNMYEYDFVGNRINNTDLKGTHNYNYDSLYQLIQATHPDSPLEGFSYDKTGNRISEIEGEQVLNYTHIGGNRIQSRNGTVYEHDKNGNIISKTDASGKTSYIYDYENKLIKAILPSGAVAEYKYDPFGRRIEKSAGGMVTRYLYDNEDITAEYDGNNNLKAEYVHGAGIDEPLAMIRAGQNYYYHADGLGSITALTDQAGATVQKYEYDSFGEIISVSDPSFIQPYTYTAREYDRETGLYYYRARYYDAEIGRFISEDPIGFEGGINYFTYVENNSLNWLDPYGLVELPKDPSDLPPNWKPDPSHKNPCGKRFRDPSGRPLDWHPGQPGKPGWGGKDHYHDPNNFGKKHLPPGTKIPDPAEPPVKPTTPWWRVPFRWPGPFPIFIFPPGWECIIDPNKCGDPTRA